MPNLYLGVLGLLQGVFASKMYSSKDIEFVPNLATRDCGVTVVNPNVYQGVLGGF